MKHFYKNISGFFNESHEELFDTILKKSPNSGVWVEIGTFIGNKTANYSLYELMNGNPGYDVVFYPQYETKVFKPVLGIGFITKITKVKTTARLGKLNK